MQPSGDIATLIANARAQRRNVLTEPEAKALLRAHGIPVPAGRVVRTAEEGTGRGEADRHAGRRQGGLPATDP